MTPNSQTQIIIFGEDTVANQVIGKITKQKVIAKYGNPERVSLDLRGMTAQHNLSTVDMLKSIVLIEREYSNCIYVIAGSLLAEDVIEVISDPSQEYIDMSSNLNSKINIADLVTRIYDISDYQAIIN